MNAVILLPVLVCIIGMLMFVLSTNPKISEMGRIAFAFGLLVSLLVFSGRTIHI